MDNNLVGHLRQMIAALEDERQALATLDLDQLNEAVQAKETLCNALDGYGADALDAETRPLLAAARQLNEINQRVRNLLAANVANRLEALGVPQPSYRVQRLAARA
jgi:hypothetical protein